MHRWARHGGWTPGGRTAWWSNGCATTPRASTCWTATADPPASSACSTSPSAPRPAWSRCSKNTPTDCSTGLGAAYCPEAGLHAFLLRHLLHRVRSRGVLLTVSTPDPVYQRLLRGLRFRRHGTTTDDIYRCGRRPEIYSQDFGQDALPDRMERLVPAPNGAAPRARRAVHRQEHALERA